MPSEKPLAGITVVEIGHSVAAPYAGFILAELGAEVIKVENPNGGDYARGWGPPFWDGTASAYHALNRGKSGITVDFGNAEEAARLKRLVLDRADAVIQNLRAGVMERHGLGAAELTAEKPELIYCDLGAFGEGGPLSDKPGYDPLMQAFAGIMSVTGEGGGRPPIRVGVSIIDMGSGMWATIGILAALFDRTRTGRGKAVGTSLYETALAWMSVPLAGYAANGEIRKPYGSGTAEIVPYQCFATRDGWLMIAAGNDNLFRKFCAAVSAPELAAGSALPQQQRPRAQSRDSDPARRGHHPRMADQGAHDGARYCRDSERAAPGRRPGLSSSADCGGRHSPERPGRRAPDRRRAADLQRPALGL